MPSDKLTDRRIQSLERGTRPNKTTKVADGKGLCLEVPPVGSLRWRYRFRVNGKEQKLSLGVYPEVSLREAREARDDMARQRRTGVNPAHERAVLRSPQKGSAPTFKEVALEWLPLQSWEAVGAEKNRRRLDRHVYPAFGDVPIDEITALLIRDTIAEIGRQTRETARRVHILVSGVMQYALDLGLIPSDPTPTKRSCLGMAKPGDVSHRAAILEIDPLQAFWRTLKADDSGNEGTRLGLKLLILTGLRNKECRLLEWSMVKDDHIEVPAGLMKAGREHRVPLSLQARKVLDRLRELSDGSAYVLPSPRNRNSPLSAGTFKAVIARLGYNAEDVTPHGFRSSLSTLANRAKDDERRRRFDADTIERALAHVEGNKIRGSYNHDDAFDDRVDLMQWWADLLDGA